MPFIRSIRIDSTAISSILVFRPNDLKTLYNALEAQLITRLPIPLSHSTICAIFSLAESRVKPRFWARVVIFARSPRLTPSITLGASAS